MFFAISASELVLCYCLRAKPLRSVKPVEITAVSSGVILARADEVEPRFDDLLRGCMNGIPCQENSCHVLASRAFIEQIYTSRTERNIDFGFI